MLELYYKFFIKFCNINKKLERDTDSLYLAFAKKELEDCIRPEKQRSGRGCGQMTVSIVSLPILKQIFSPEHVV